MTRNNSDKDDGWFLFIIWLSIIFLFMNLNSKIEKNYFKRKTRII